MPQQFSIPFTFAGGCPTRFLASQPSKPIGAYNGSFDQNAWRSGARGCSVIALHDREPLLRRADICKAEVTVEYPRRLFVRDDAILSSTR